MDTALTATGAGMKAWEIFSWQAPKWPVPKQP